MTSRWPLNPLCHKLGENLQRPMGSGDNLWEQIGVSVYPTAGKQTREDVFGCREVSSTITRGGKPCCKGGHTVGSRRQRGLYQSDIPCPKVRRLMAPSDKLEITEQVSNYPSFQNGINQDSKGVQRGDWLVKLDLKDAYLMVPIHSSHQKYLRFQWQGQTWKFKVLPFGLSSAPYTFSKLMKPVVSTLRKLGIRSILYLDDKLIMARSKEEARRHLATAMELLVALGFIIKLKKSTLSPTQELEFFGFLLNSHNMTIALPTHKLHAVKMARQIENTALTLWSLHFWL